MQYYACFEAKNIMAGVERGRGETEQKDEKRADAPLLPSQAGAILLGKVCR